MNIKPFVFLKNKKKNASINLSSNSIINNIIRLRHIPSITKEWRDNVYFFNFAKTKNFPVFDYLVDKLILAYFNSCFHRGRYKVKFLRTKKRLKKKLKFTRTNKGFTKIYLCKSALNYNNHMITVNLYIHNRKGGSLFRKIKSTSLKTEKFFKRFLFLSTILKKNIKNQYLQQIRLKKRKKILYKLISFVEKLKLKFNLNQYKFEERLLYILASILAKFYKKKIEINIVNIRSIALNSDIFTKIFILKSKSKKINPHRVMNFILNKAIIHKTNRIIEKTPIRKKFFWELLIKKKKRTEEILKIYSRLRREEYRYSSFIYQCINNIYGFYTNIDQIKLYENIFNSIHYKNIGGIRLEIKGRLTWRYRAERAKFKVRRKGGLRNIESSYKRLPTVMRRGDEEYNFKYSTLAGKRHVGAFAVKGWISGK